MPTPPPARTPTPTPPPARTSASTAPPHPSPLSGRLRPVDEYLRLLGLLLRPDWLESCTAALSPVGDLGVDDATGAFSVTTYDANHCPGEMVTILCPGELFAIEIHTVSMLLLVMRMFDRENKK
ncbi:unnamed protein product [Miscanthus lutarioriparius]|uniref:Uncharacterized protein n=1 Tax=Miscanthus lutarioriparius TaxID=422564 RepID=A0A811PB02_9POAL|nr:unnamed protein product [Miscanthus lutarioriparius]